MTYIRHHKIKGIYYQIEVTEKHLGRCNDKVKCDKGHNPKKNK